MDFSILEMKNWIKNDPAFSSILNILANGDHLDAAHDLAHLYRVAHWALRLNEGKSAKKNVVAAALLHDLVNLPKNHPERAMAAVYSAEKAAPLLRAAGFTEQDIAEISQAIRDHSYSRGQTPSSHLGRVLQDADRLEALGAIGLMRVFSTGARLGTKYFHTEDPWAKKRARNDLEFSVDHFFTKLLLLENSFQTERGKLEARNRTEFLQTFLKQLAAEIGEEYP
jgi:uncharacterized protein